MKLTGPFHRSHDDGKERRIWVNPERVSSVEPMETGHTIISFGESSEDDQWISVTEPVEVVVAKLTGATFA